jgi:hypothetical protein
MIIPRAYIIINFKKCTGGNVNYFKLPLLILFFTIVFNISTKAHVGLDFPVGGETFEANTTITIQWHIVIDHGECNWDLYFSSDGGSTWQAIVLDLPKSQLTHDWIVPAIVTQQGMIKVVQDNQNGIPYEDNSNAFTIEVPSAITGVQTRVNDFKLFPAYPNPFNPETKIKFRIPEAVFVSLKVYDLIGNEITTLVNAEKPAGIYEVSFDGNNLPSGIYIYRLTAANYSAVRKIVLLK